MTRTDGELLADRMQPGMQTGPRAHADADRGAETPAAAADRKAPPRHGAALAVLHLQAWPAEPQIHGGARRTAQISEWLRGQPDVRLTSWVAGVPRGRAALPGRHGLLRFFTAPQRGVLRHLTWHGRAKLLRYTLELESALAAHRPGLVVAETAPSVPLIMALALLRSGVPYVLLPHNIESLVAAAESKDFRSRGAMLDAEGALFASAQAVLAISEFDLGAARMYTPHAVSWPYYPTRGEAARFAEIRRRRAAQEARSGVIVLGSASNPPSLNGLRDVLLALQAQAPLPGEPIHVAGYKTERLREMPLPGLTIHGTISDARLDELLVQCRCGIVGQPFTSGGLTRLVELNLCGVPVVITGPYLQARGLERHGIYARPTLTDAARFIADIETRQHAPFEQPQLALADIAGAQARAPAAAATELLSIVTISYNQARHLPAALESIHGHGVPRIEHVVVDPGSSDASRAVLDACTAPLHRIYEPDRGPADGLNKGFAATTGSLLYFLNADDLVCPGALDYARDFFAANPHVDVLYGGGYIADEAGTLTKFVRPTYFSCATYLHDATNLTQQAFFFRRAAFERVGGFNLDNRVSWDGELFFEMKRAGLRFHAVYAPLGVFRVYGSTITSSQGHVERRRQVRARLWRDYYGRARTPLDTLAGIGWRVVKQVSALAIWLRTAIDERRQLQSARVAPAPMRSVWSRWLPVNGRV